MRTTRPWGTSEDAYLRETMETPIAEQALHLGRPYFDVAKRRAQLLAERPAPVATQTYQKVTSTIERTQAALEALSQRDHGAYAYRIAQRAGLPLGTVHKHLHDLVAMGEARRLRPGFYAPTSQEERAA